MVLALSLSEQIEKAGSFAGIAAFFGLALLTILYFAQAREVRRLRDWAGRAPERDAELQARVAADAARRVRTPPAARPAPAAPARTGAVTPAGAAAAPVATVAPAATAPAEGTEVPAEGEAAAANGAAPPAEGEKPAETSAPAEDETPPAAAEGTAPPAAAVPDTPTEQPVFVPEPLGAPEPATTGNGAPSAPAGPPTIPPRATPLPQRTPPPSVRRPGQPAVPLRSTAAASRRPPAAAARVPDDEGRGRGLLYAGIGVAAVGLVVLVVVLLGGGEERPQPNVPAAEVTPSPTPGDSTPTRPSRSAARGEITVSVLNGTTVTGLAAGIAEKLVEAGFERGTTANFSDQARSASLVFYAEGQRRAASEVARVLDLPAGDVQPATGDTLALAGDQAEVIVVVGSDQTP